MAHPETKQETKAKAPAAPKPTDFELTIEEFCARLSKTDRRVELIGAFHATETKAGRHKDRDAQFRSRFQAFIKQPA